MELSYSIFMLLFKIHYFWTLPTGTYKHKCLSQDRVHSMVGEVERMSVRKVIPSRGNSVCPGFKVRNSKSSQYSSMPHKTHIL